jgi:hypothetical protein
MDFIPKLGSTKFIGFLVAVGVLVAAAILVPVAAYGTLATALPALYGIYAAGNVISGHPSFQNPTVVATDVTVNETTDAK